MGAQDDKFCPLPWIHLGTHPHGGVTPCCISDMTAGKNRARKQNGKKTRIQQRNRATE